MYRVDVGIIRHLKNFCLPLKTEVPDACDIMNA